MTPFTRLLLALALLLVSSCRGGGRDPGTTGATDAAAARPAVVATTTMLADLVAQLAGDPIDVESLVPVGADPHTLQPRPSDARRIARARLVVTNGLGLEGWIDDLVRSAGGNPAIVVAGDAVEPLSDGSGGPPDPHFWFDPARWDLAAGRVAEATATLLPDDASRAALVERRQRLSRRLLALDTWARAQLATIPAAHRTLVTSHDAFRYLGARYGLDVVAIQGVSTEQEASQRDVIRVVDLVRARGLPAIFVESSVHPGLVEQVARETGARAIGPLHSDSLGPPGSDAATWEGMFVHNIRTIVEGLGGTFAPWTPPPTGTP